ncbi:MAG: hypothetical protein GYA59_09560 [Chloroflexi bacterium]|nr:hypothetical protein [Chloroflexota bacterium]
MKNVAQQKFDGVIEAVRYTPEGQVGQVRIYERRGPTFSDRVLLTREQLVQRMKAGQRFVAGERKEFLASTFVVRAPVRLAGPKGKEVLVTTQPAGDGDDLHEVPLF